MQLHKKSFATHLFRNTLMNLRVKSVVQHKNSIQREIQQEVDATHQVLLTEASELLKLLRHEELSAAYRTTDRPQNYKECTRQAISGGAYVKFIHAV